MTPVLRLLCAASLLAAYYGSLFPGAFVRGEVPSATAATLADGSLLRDIDASEVAYTAGRYADALEPTRRLTEKMPSQALYFDRLAHIHRELGHRSDEA